MFSFKIVYHLYGCYIYIHTHTPYYINTAIKHFIFLKNLKTIYFPRHFPLIILENPKLNISLYFSETVNPENDICDDGPNLILPELFSGSEFAISGLGVGYVLVSLRWILGIPLYNLVGFGWPTIRADLLEMHL